MRRFLIFLFIFSFNVNALTVMGYIASDGNMGGVRGASSLCHASWPGSHWATYKEMMSLDGSYNFGGQNLWVQNPIRESTYDWSGNRTYYILGNGVVYNGSGKPKTLDCNGWTTNSNTVNGWQMIFSYNLFNLLTCDNTARKIMCVK